MKKGILCYLICGKHRKFENPKISYIFKKTFFQLFEAQEWRWKNIYRRRINWDIEDSWFDWKYINTLKILLKKT